MPFSRFSRRPGTALRRRGAPVRRSALGFTLIELLAVVALLGLLATLASPKLRLAVEKAKEVKAISDLKSIAVELANMDTLPATLDAIGWGDRLDPWERPYVYVPFGAGPGVPAGARTDRFSIPLNTRYDLYSVGRDGGTSQSLGAGSSMDDLVVANDGGFVGHGKAY
jgi:general secretion pathway protein G